MLVYLLVFDILLLAILLWIHKSDFMSPDVLVCLVYAIAIILSLYNRDIWKLDDYSVKTACIIGISISCFAIAGVFEDRRWRIRAKHLSVPQNYEMKEIRISYFVALMNATICLLALYLTIRSNGNSLYNLMNALGASSKSYTSSTYEGTSSILSILSRYTDITVYFFAFVFINNLVVKKLRGSDYLNILAVFSIILRGMLCGTRMTVLHVVACMGFSFYFLYNRKKGWIKRYNVKFIFYIIFGMSALLFFFYKIRDYRGTTTNMDFVYYISLYTSAPIKLLDLFVKDPIYSNIWGKETFRNLNNNLSIFGNNELRYERHLEFRGMGSIDLGNVYGASRRYYSDFGIVGVIILTLILAFIICRLYYKNKYYNTNEVGFSLVVLSFLYFSVPMYIIDDVFFTEISIGFALNIFILFIMYYFLIARRKVIKCGDINIT